MSSGVRVEGLNKTVRGLTQLGVEVDDLKDGMAAIADAGATLARGFAPRDTGRLEASIRGNRAKAKAQVIAGRARVPYAGAINYGWRARGIRASGFMQRADEQLQPKAVGMLEDAVDTAIRKSGLA